MKRKLFIISLFLIPLSLWGALRGDIKILEASEKIKLHINNFAVDYLLLYKFPYKIHLKSKLKKDLKLLSQNMQDVSQLTDDQKSKRLLRFFAYQFSTLEEILNKKPDKKALREILDISESFVEGFDLISSKHIYNFSYEEEMLTNTKAMEQRIKEISKYYLTLKIIGENGDTVKKLKNSITAFEKSLVKIDDYRYDTPDMIDARQKIDKLWSVTYLYIKNTSKISFPMIVDISSENIGSTLKKLAIYHSKKQ